MRIYKAAYCREIMRYKNDVCARKGASRERMIYTCSNCKYQSHRRFNVVRHQERIHWNVRLNICCGIRFFNKGDYYVHCEQMHPHQRICTMITRTKYKVNNESLNRQINDAQVTNSWQLQLNRQLSDKVVVNDQRMTRKLKSNLTLKYLITYSDFKGLMSFFTDQKVNSYLKLLPRPKSPFNLTNETGKRSEMMQTVEISISSTQSVEKGSSKNDANNYQTKLFDSSSISLKLPPKKLILHRFRSDVVQEREIPLRQQNNNCTVQVNPAEKRVEENTLSMLQNRAEKHPRFNRRNKENVSKFPVNRGEQLNVRLDRNITVPVANESYRDILGPFDFGRYEIF